MGSAAVTAAQDYANWNSDSAVLSKDPIRAVAQVMARLTTVTGDLLSTQKDEVTKVTDHMARINEAMKLLAEDLASLSSQSPANDNERKKTRTGSKEAMEAYKKKFTDEGILGGTPPDGNLELTVLTAATTTPPAAAVYQIVWTKTFLTKAQQSLQLTADNLSSTNQASQLRLQTMLGRYNGSFEVVTSSIKKSETLGDSVNANIKK